MKKSSLTIKTLFILSSFVILILLSLWVIQVKMTGIFYESHQVKRINYVASKVQSQSPTLLDFSLEKYAYKYDMCIEYYNGNEYSSYNTKMNGCILNNMDPKVTDYKKALINNEKKYMKVYDDTDKIKSLIYYVNIDEDRFAFLNINLEDENSSSYLLKNQLIYLVLILIIISFFVSIFVSRIINKPIIKLTEEAKKLGKGVPVNFEESNIKELDELSNTLKIAASEMNKTNELRKDLIANVSHDLKTPLTMIKAYAEKVRDLSYANDEKRNKDLNVIIEETNRLNNLVNDLLDLSKLESGINNLEYEEYDLVANIKEIIKRYDILIEDNNYKFELDLPKELIVKADKQKIEQVIYNLINNAIEHTGDDLVVKVSIKKSNTYYKVSITDTGGHLKDSDKALVWNKYYKKEKQHKRNVVGSGLGLSIVKNILEAHKLPYGIDSKENQYTTFYFKIKKYK